MSGLSFAEYLQDLDSSLEEYESMGVVEKASLRNLWNDELRKREAHQLAMQKRMVRRIFGVFTHWLFFIRSDLCSQFISWFRFILSSLTKNCSGNEAEGFSCRWNCERCQAFKWSSRQRFQISSEIFWLLFQIRGYPGALFR